MKSKKYKNLPTSREAIFGAAPGLQLTESLFATSPGQMFCIKNYLRQYVSVNRAFVLRSRVANEAAVIGKTASELFPHVLAAKYEQQDSAVLSGGKSLRDKLEMITNHDGSTGWYLTQKLPVRDAANRVIAIVSVSSDLQRPAAGDPRLAALADAVEHIQRDFRGPLRIEAVARSVKLSLAQFERNTGRILGISPRQLLTQTRIQAAAKALLETTIPLGQIAAQCGFYDQAQFCRQFNSATGLTPNRYRQSVRNVRR